MAIRWWRTQHPQPIFGGGEEAGLHPSMLLTLMLSLLAITFLYLLLLRLRFSTREIEGEVEELRESIGR
jgi:heme exporter protein C